MVLNKFRKYVKWVFDGERIVKIGKRELYPRVYKRVWNMSNYSADVLDKYSLEPKEYLYIGQSKSEYISHRDNNWATKIKQQYKVNKDILEFIDNLKRFYKQELKYSNSMIDRIIIPAGEILCRCENKSSAMKLEKHITGQYSFLSLFDDSFILLSDKDSTLKIDNVDGIKMLRSIC